MVRALWIVVVSLVAIGVGASVRRTIYPADSLTRLDSARTVFLEMTGVVDPLAADRPAEIRRMDSPFARHPDVTLLHVIPGAVFLILAPIQFLPFVRRRFLAFHRWSGRVLLMTALVIALSALFFGVLMPFGGTGEAVAIALFAVMFLVALATAWLAIRRGQAARHREWMIRAFATAIAISTVRVFGSFVELPFTLMGIRPAEGFVISVWTSWLMTVVAAELWIGRTRVDPTGANSPRDASLS